MGLALWRGAGLAALLLACALFVGLALCRFSGLVALLHVGGLLGGRVAGLARGWRLGGLFAVELGVGVLRRLVGGLVSGRAAG